MKTGLLAGALPAVLFLIACGGQEQPSQEEAKDISMDRITIAENARIEILDDEGHAIIDSSATVEVLGSGYEWSEGPVYIPGGDYLLFSDIPRNRIMKWKEGEGVSLYLEPSGATGEVKPKVEPGSNGLALDANGSLVLCQHGDRRLGRLTAPLDNPRPEYTTIVDRYNDKRLNSPNDATYHPNGDLYFTDPPYGLDGRTDDPARELDFHGVFRVKPDGTVDLLTKEFNYPNGIAFFPGGKSMIVAHSDMENPAWRKYELDDQGMIRAKSLFYRVTPEEFKANPGLPDGLKINSLGQVFASGPGGIWVFNAEGKVLARIYTGQLTSNCAFSPDEKMLYMTCDDFLYRVKLK